MVITSEAAVHRLGYVGSIPGPGRDSDQWYTPSHYLDAARSALGGRIDLDPYTSEAANERVRAAHTFTLDHPAPPGADWPLCDTAWMNPPYSGSLVLEAATAFVESYRARRFQRGICLVNNASETRFFQLLLREAAAVCLTDHRISFENVDGKRISGNTRGQAFFWFSRGPVKPFAAAFSPFGPVLRCGRFLVKGGR